MRKTEAIQIKLEIMYLVIVVYFLPTLHSFIFLFFYECEKEQAVKRMEKGRKTLFLRFYAKKNKLKMKKEKMKKVFMLCFFFSFV
jgi:hypothetical protein